jgi:hypothetical protein
MEPDLISGVCYIDNRGSVIYNNYFDFSICKRCYIIENSTENSTRAWQGHKVEQRWFIAIVGILKITLIKIDNWDFPTKSLSKLEFLLNSDTMNILHVPSGFISSIESLETGSKLFVMSDYGFKEIEDDYRFPFDYFNI